jgi:hypothetical protein
MQDHDTCGHANTKIDLADQAFCVLCADCDFALAFEWMDETIPDEMLKTVNIDEMNMEHVCDDASCSR